MANLNRSLNSGDIGKKFRVREDLTIGRYGFDAFTRSMSILKGIVFEIDRIDGTGRTRLNGWGITGQMLETIEEDRFIQI